MSFTAYKGPLVAFGRGRATASPSGAGAFDYNENSPSPSIFEYGIAMLDSRSQFAYQPDQGGAFYGHSILGPVIDQVPAEAAVNNIALAQAPTAGTPLTLTAGTGVSRVTITDQSTGQPVSVLALDGAMGSVAFGAAPNLVAGGASWFAAWDPTKALSRAVRVHSAGNDGTATFLVSGYDIYGFPMTQLLTGADAGDADTLKAFKYILSVTPAGTLSGSNVSVGTLDVFGFPLFASAFAYTTIYWNSALITASTDFVAGVPTSPSTNLLGDVRGTYAAPDASDGVKSLQVIWRPSVAGLQAGVTGVYGVTQV
jgi:hypothetical protein